MQFTVVQIRLLLFVHFRIKQIVREYVDVSQISTVSSLNSVTLSSSDLILTRQFESYADQRSYREKPLADIERGQPGVIFILSESYKNRQHYAELGQDI